MILNFRWFIEGKLAGSSKPCDADDVRFLVDQGVRSVVSLEPVSQAVSEALAFHDLHRLLFYMDDDEAAPAPSAGDLEIVLSFAKGNLTLARPVLVHCSAGIRRTGRVGRWLREKLEGPAGCAALFSLGYSAWKPGRRIEGVVGALTKAGVKTLVDVRLSPCSASLSGSYGPRPWNLQPSSEGGQLQGLVAHLEAAGVGYQWIPELGNPQKNDRSMAVFRQHLAESAVPWPAQRGLDRLAKLLVDSDGPACLLCTCANLNTCHASLVIGALENRPGAGRFTASRLSP